MEYPDAGSLCFTWLSVRNATAKPKVITLSRTLTTLAVSICYFFGVFGTHAYAYLDPASGSAFMSAVIGICVAIGIFVKTYWYKLKSIFGFGKRSHANRDQQDD